MRLLLLPPFALSLSKGLPELVEGISLCSMEGFDKLSPNEFKLWEAVHG